MTEVDVVALQLITAARLATSATAAGPTAASAAGGGGAAGSHVAAIVDVNTGNVDQEWLVGWQWALFWSLVDHGAVKLIRRTSDPN